MEEGLAVGEAAGGGVGFGVEQVARVTQGVTEAEDGGVGGAVISGEGVGKW